MKLLFCSLSSYGFVYPLIGIAQAVRSLGHEVMFVTGPEFSQTLQNENFSRIPRGGKDGESFDVKTWGFPLSVGIQIKHIEYALSMFPADMLVTTQLALGPLLVAERRRLPVAVLGLASYMWPPLWPSDFEPKSQFERRLQWRYGDMMRHFNEARSLFGLPAVNGDCAEPPWLGDLFMIQTVPELERNEFGLPSKVHFVGSCVWEPESPDTELSDWLEESAVAGEPVIYVQPGRNFGFPSFWPHIREVLTGKKVRVAASLGKMTGDIGDAPDNFFVRDHLPMKMILPYSSAVITTGHTTSVLGALTHGLPSLLIACGSATEDIAERCESAGAALCFYDYERGVDTPFIEKAVDELLSNKLLKERAEKLQIAFARAGGANLVAELIEKLEVAHRKVDSRR